jgi:hypothetical protein
VTVCRVDDSNGGGRRNGSFRMWCHVLVRVAALGVSQVDLRVGPNRFTTPDARGYRFALAAVFVLAIAIAFAGFARPSDTTALRCAPRCSDSPTLARSAGTSQTCIQDPGCGGAATMTSHATASPVVLAQPTVPVTATVVGYSGHHAPAPAADRVATSGLFRPPR